MCELKIGQEAEDRDGEGEREERGRAGKVECNNLSLICFSGIRCSFVFVSLFRVWWCHLWCMLSPLSPNILLSPNALLITSFQSLVLILDLGRARNTTTPRRACVTLPGKLYQIGSCQRTSWPRILSSQKSSKLSDHCRRRGKREREREGERRGEEREKILICLF